MKKQLFTIIVCVACCMIFAGCAVAAPKESGKEEDVAAQEEEEEEEKTAKAEKTSKSFNKKDKDDNDNGWTSLNGDDDDAPADALSEFVPRDTSNNMSSSEMDRIQDKLNSIKYNGFLQSNYMDPLEIDWFEVFYVGAGMDQGRPSLKVVDEYLDATGNNEVFTDLTVLSGEDVKRFVKETTGYDYSEMKKPLDDWVYLKDEDLYIYEHGDTNQTNVHVNAGHYEDDQYNIVYDGPGGIPYCVSFIDKGGKFRFLSNLPEWMAKDPTNGGDVDQSTITDGMIIPDSDSRKLTEDDLRGLSKEELRIARNEIYARHGRKFTDKGLQDHFNSMDWYFPSIDAKDFDESTISKIERYNLDLITEYEKKVK